jgi:hypothetical protein
MNLWWHVFDTAESPLGGWNANLARLLTVVAAVCLTWQRDRIRFLRGETGHDGEATEE